MILDQIREVPLTHRYSFPGLRMKRLRYRVRKRLWRHVLALFLRAFPTPFILLLEWAHIEHCGQLSIGVIDFTDKDTEGGRHQRSHRSSPRTIQPYYVLISEVLSNSVEWFNSSFPPSLSVSRLLSLKRLSTSTVIHRYMGNPRR